MSKGSPEKSCLRTRHRSKRNRGPRCSYPVYAIPFPKGIKCKNPQQLLDSQDLKVIIDWYNRDPRYGKGREKLALSLIDIILDVRNAIKLQNFLTRHVIVGEENELQLTELITRTINYIRRLDAQLNAKIDRLGGHQTAALEGKKRK